LSRIHLGYEPSLTDCSFVLGNALEFWNLGTRKRYTTFSCDAVLTCCAFLGDRMVAGADELGRVHFLALE
jgi:hypothetical protein